MAIYHLHVSTGSKAAGQSAKAKAQYVLRQGRYKKGNDEVLFFLSENMPAWASKNPMKYWAAADLGERGNGVLFRQVEFALPVELSLAQQTHLTKIFSKHVSRGELPWTLALHKGKGHNPHCHLLLSERINDGFDRTPETWFKRAAPADKPPETGGARKADISSKRKTWLAEVRQAWANLANHYLEKAGFSSRVDHRTLAAQGEVRLPQIHMGPAAVEMEQKGLRTDRADLAMEIVATNQLQEELQQIEKEIQDEQQRTRPRKAGPQPPPANRGIRTPTPGSQSANQQAGKGGVGHEPRPEKPPAAAPATSKRQEATRPTSRPLIPLAQEGGQEMFSPSEQQEFLRVRRQIVAQQQAEAERRRQELSEEQKRRFEEIIRLEEEAVGKRPDQLYLENCFALDCLAELRRRHQTVEQADWCDVERHVATGLLRDGADLADVAEVVFENGISAAPKDKEFKDPAAPRDGQTPNERVALEYLKSLAAVSPADRTLQDEIELAEKRQKDEAWRQSQAAPSSSTPAAPAPPKP